jgi:hypothetical protein
MQSFWSFRTDTFYNVYSMLNCCLYYDKEAKKSSLCMSCPSIRSGSAEKSCVDPILDEAEVTAEE